MHWIVQNNIFNENEWHTLIETFERFNISYSVHKVVPFIGELIPEPSISHNNVICIGSYAMRHYAEKMKYNPGVFDIQNQTFGDQMKHWGKHMLNADSIVCEFKDAYITEPMFIRPVDDSKSFAGSVFDPDDFNSWRESICKNGDDFGISLTPNTKVQLSYPKKIYSEHRFWIVKDQIVTYSQYKIGNRVVYSNNVDERFIQKAWSLTHPMYIDYWKPHDAYCLDLCETDDGIKIVEINTLNSAGFYAADIQKLVMKLEGVFTQK